MNTRRRAVSRHSHSNKGMLGCLCFVLSLYILFRSIIVMAICDDRISVKLEDKYSQKYSNPIVISGIVRSPKLICIPIIIVWLLSFSYAGFPVLSSNNHYAFALSNNTKNSASIETNTNSNSTIPVITKISDKGVYMVQLKWSNPTLLQSPNVPATKGFDMQVLFLNASASQPNAKTVPQKETNVTGDSTINYASGFNQPDILQRLMPIDSYDITIYDNKGHILWSKTNETAAAGSGFERVTFSKQYSGDVTIQISNIKNIAGNMGATAAGPIAGKNASQSSLQSTVDSVKFRTNVS